MASQHRGDSDEKSGLSALIRPIFSDGQVVDAAKLQLAERYLDEKQKLLSRLSIGSGVLSGLLLDVGANGTSVMIGPGVAMDRLGRLIVVPETVELDPTQLTDPEGNPAGKATHGDRTVALAFRTREVEAGSAIEETYAVLLLEGELPSVGHFSALEALRQLGASPPLRRAGDDSFARVLRELERSSQAGEDAPRYVVLGRVSTRKSGDRAGTVEISDKGRRLIVDSASLLQLLSLLWTWIEEILRHLKPTPTPTPRTVPTPTPTPKVWPMTTPTPKKGMNPTPKAGEATKDAGKGQAKAKAKAKGRPGQGKSALAEDPSASPAGPLPLLGVEFLDPAGRPVGKLDPTLRPFRHDEGQTNAGVAAFQMTFGRPLAAGSCTASDPASASVLVRSNWSRAANGHVPGLVSVQGSVARYQVDGGLTTFPPGDYEVTLFGDPDPTSNRPVIAAADGGRLDGEPRGLPSGDGAEGGNFIFRMRIAGA